MSLDFRDKIFVPLLCIAASFFGARCMLFDLVCPVGCALLALMLTKKRLWPALAAACAGIATRSGDIYIIGYILAFAGLGITDIAIKYAALTPTSWGRALVAGLCMTMGALVGAALEGISTFTAIIAILQGLLSALLTVVFYEGVRAFKSGGGGELYGMSLLAGCVLGGMGGITVLGVPLVLIVCAALLPLAMGKRVLTAGDGTSLRRRACARLDGFARSMERLSSSLKNVTDTIEDGGDTEHLEKSLKKTRELLSGELNGAAALIRGLSEELREELAPDVMLGEDIKKRLKQKRIRCEDVLVYNNGGSCEVNVVRRQGSSCDRCVAPITAEVSREIGIKMVKSAEICHSDSRSCTLRLRPELPWRISAYAAAKKRDGSSVSGDSHTFMELKYGKYMLALSDGMGSGGKAREESAASVELFEDFMEAGFDRDMALDEINSLLLMRAGGEDIFATMDICNIDLFNGCAEFVKIGGMPSFIAGSDGVRLVGSGGLPVGIMDTMEKDSAEVMLESGDVIVMVTDGVAEAAPCAIGKENWLARVIDKYSSLPPERLCEKILDEAVGAENGMIRDDMTVMAAKVWKV